MSLQCNETFKNNFQHCNIAINELTHEKSEIINDNLSLFKRLGRVVSVYKSNMDKSGVKIIVDGETVTLYFDKDLDLNEQKIKITDKVKNIDAWKA